MNRLDDDGWGDLEYPEDWCALGRAPDDARAWGMDLMLAEQWIRICMTPIKAHERYAAGVEPERVGEWLHADWASTKRPSRDTSRRRALRRG